MSINHFIVLVVFDYSHLSLNLSFFKALNLIINDFQWNSSYKTSIFLLYSARFLLFRIKFLTKKPLMNLAYLMY